MTINIAKCTVTFEYCFTGFMLTWTFAGPVLEVADRNQFSLASCQDFLGWKLLSPLVLLSTKWLKKEKVRCLIVSSHIKTLGSVSISISDIFANLSTVSSLFNGCSSVGRITSVSKASLLSLQQFWELVQYGSILNYDSILYCYFKRLLDSVKAIFRLLSN